MSFNYPPPKKSTRKRIADIRRRIEDKLLQIAMSIVFTLFSGIPTWMFLLIRHFAPPHGFWQNFALYGGGVWFLGGLQFLLGLAWITVMFYLWTGSGF